MSTTSKSTTIITSSLVPSASGQYAAAMASSPVSGVVSSLVDAATQTQLLCQRQDQPDPEESTPNQQPLNLETIPLDVLYLITSRLDYPTTLALSSTSKSLRNVLQPGLANPKSNLPIPLRFFGEKASLGSRRWQVKQDRWWA